MNHYFSTGRGWVIPALLADAGIIIAAATLCAVTIPIAFYHAAESMAIFLMSMLFLLYVYDCYSVFLRTRYETILSVVLSGGMAGVVTLLYQGLLRHPTMWYTLGLAFAATAAISGEKLLRQAIWRRRRGVLRLLILASEQEDAFIDTIMNAYSEIYQAEVARIDTGDEAEVKGIVAERFCRCDSVFLSSGLPLPIREYYVGAAMDANKELYLLPDLYSINTMKSKMVSFDDTPALRILPFGLTNLQKSGKRLFDVVFSAVVLIAAAPIMGLCAVAVRWDSPGPVFYRQERVTRGEKTFMMYKFRTMHHHAERETGAVLATQEDPRITTIGKFLRATRLDELPQLWNVLIGQMSVVGPRPERPMFVRQYKQSVENYAKRFSVKGGLTGTAQVYGRYATAPHYKILYDLLYIKDYSFWMDIKVILLTIKVMFVRKSAAGVAPMVNPPTSGTAVSM